MVVTRSIAMLLVLVAACGDGSGRADSADAAALADASASGADAGGERPGPGFGVIDGDCDVLDAELISPAPAIFRASIEFERLYVDEDQADLSAGAVEIIADGNAGGSSLLSEVFAFEVLSRCESAMLLKTETEVEYDQVGKLTDFLASIDDQKIGVSVTRAVAFPFDAPYPVSQAEELLSNKLADVLVSSANVSEADRWQKQILAILAFGPEHADALADAYAELDAGVLADTLVFVIVTNGTDDFIYCDGACE